MEDLLKMQIHENCRLALPEGLNDLMSDISREVLREQSKNLLQFITDYLSALLVSRENLATANRICENICNNLQAANLEDELRYKGIDQENIDIVKSLVESYFTKHAHGKTELIRGVQIVKTQTIPRQRCLFVYSKSGMNELLQKHGCSNVFTIPDGLRELMADISREVLREHPVKIYDFITNYLSCLLISREHGILAGKLLEDLCDCKPTVSEHLMQIGMPASDANDLATIIKEEITGLAMVEGKEKVREQEILKRILRRTALDEEVMAKVCQVARNAYRDYWYRKRMLEKNLKVSSEEPWEIAAQHTNNLYKRTTPSVSELTRATERIQAAYKGYHVRRKMLGHLKPKKLPAPQADLPGPPLDIADSRVIDLGRVVDIRAKVKTEDVSKMFKEQDSKNLGLPYDTTLTITHQPEDEEEPPQRERAPSRMMSSKNMQTEIFGSQPASKTAYPEKTVSTTVPPVIATSATAPTVKAASATATPVKAAEKVSFGAHFADDTPKGTPRDGEVPEDIVTGDKSDASSAPIASDRTSAPSTAPSTAPGTDIEDFADASGQEE